MVSKKQKNQIFFNYSFFIKNRRGWIKIVEAVVAILIILGVILMIINSGNTPKEDISEKVYNAEYLMLREIELDQTLREDILNVSNSSLPVDWPYFNVTGLINVANRIIEKTPDYLECEAKLCQLNKICTIDRYQDKDLYAKSIAITTSLNVYSPRQLKLFCWVK